MKGVSDAQGGLLQSSTIASLSILQAHVADGSFTTFGCVEWEPQLFRGVIFAICYPFDMTKRRFHGFNPKVRGAVALTFSVP